MKFLVNAFSINMIETNKKEFSVSFVELDLIKARELILTGDYRSVIGHQDFAWLVSDLIGVDYRFTEFNRSMVKFRAGDEMIVAQYTGPRLQEGTTELPSDAKITFYLVTM